jgi:endoglucanase
MPHYGFNFQWMFSWREGHQPQEPDLKALDFLAEQGFDFVRITTDYRFWTKNHDYFNPDEQVFEYIDRYIDECRKRGIHMSLNQHRAPGYCINANHLEKHNLWLEQTPQDAFVFLWETFARRYQDVPVDVLSFDLVNEPPCPGQYGMTRENHAAIMRRTAKAIWSITPDREVVLDGVCGGGIAIPELADLGVTHSGRGYAPMPISHHQASWVNWGDKTPPPPVYPGVEWDGKVWNFDTVREFYQPWKDVEAQGVKVHIGEMGCYNKTPNDVALRWLGDLLKLYKEYGWGFSFWNFVGPFGIIDHGRPGARIEEYQGYNVDRDLLDLMLSSRE